MRSLNHLIIASFSDSSGLNSLDADLGALCSESLLRLTANGCVANAWDHRLLLILLFNRFLLFDLSLLFVKVLALRRKSIHFDSEVAKGAFECFPVINIVEHLQAISLHERLIHIRELI